MKLPVEKEPPCAMVALGVVVTDASGSPGTLCGRFVFVLAIVLWNFATGGGITLNHRPKGANRGSKAYSQRPRSCYHRIRGYV